MHIKHIRFLSLLSLSVQAFKYQDCHTVFTVNHHQCVHYFSHTAVQSELHPGVWCYGLRNLHYRINHAVHKVRKRDCTHHIYHNSKNCCIDSPHVSTKHIESPKLQAHFCNTRSKGNNLKLSMQSWLVRKIQAAKSARTGESVMPSDPITNENAAYTAAQPMLCAWWTQLWLAQNLDECTKHQKRVLALKYNSSPPTTAYHYASSALRFRLGADPDDFSCLRRAVPRAIQIAELSIKAFALGSRSFVHVYNNNRYVRFRPSSFHRQYCHNS